MKSFYLSCLIVIFQFLCTNGILAQTTQTKLDQIELMKQFTGTWLSERNDTTYMIEDKLFGVGHEVYMKLAIKGEVVFEAKTLMGYDMKNDMLIEAFIQHGSPNISLSSIRFVSPNKWIAIRLEESSNPEKATEKDIYELKSPDLMINTYIKNDEIVSVDTLRRVK